MPQHPYLCAHHVHANFSVLPAITGRQFDACHVQHSFRGSICTQKPVPGYGRCVGHCTVQCSTCRAQRLVVRARMQAPSLAHIGQQMACSSCLAAQPPKLAQQVSGPKACSNIHTVYTHPNVAMLTTQVPKRGKMLRFGFLSSHTCSQDEH